jgi:hypothetical protein
MSTKLIRFLFLIISVFLCVVLWGAGLDLEEARTDKILRVKINLSDEKSYRGAELDNYKQIRMEGMPEGLYDLIVSQEEYSKLLSQGFDLEIVSSDYKQSMSVLSDLFFTNDSAYAFINSLQKNYPDIVKVDSIGTTHEHRTIWCVKLSEDVEVDDPDKPGIFYSGGIHANELVGTNVVLAIMDTIVSGYNLGDQDMIDILQDYQIWIVPILNPDGVAFVHEHQDLTWRKNRRDNGDGSYGVDLNRNFAYKWAYDNSGSSPDPSNNYSYRGPSPFSEPESQAIRNFFTGSGSENRHIVTLITYHMKYGGGAFLYPWYYYNGYTEHYPVYYQVADDFTEITGTIHGNAQNVMGYCANGSLDEWVYATSSFNSTTIASTVEAGGYGYMPNYPVDLLLSTHIPANLQLIQSTEAIMDSVSVIDNDIPASTSTCNWVTGSNDTLLYGADSLVKIALISDINHPDFTSDIILDGNPDDIHYKHSKLYTIYTTILGNPYWCKVIDSISVYDISDLYNPTRLKMYRLPAHIYDVQFTDDYLVLLDSTGMKIMRETESYQLVKVGEYITPVKTSNLAIDGQIAYIANDSYEDGEPLYIVNISDPSSPQLLGQSYPLWDSTGVHLNGLSIYNGLLFVSGCDDGGGHPLMAVLDVDNPDSVSLLNWLQPGEFQGGSVSFYENIAFIASDCGYYLYNCNNPKSIGYFDNGDLELPDIWDNPFSASAPVFLNHYGFVAKEDEGLYIIDVTNPLTPYWLYEFGGIPVGVKEQEIIIPLTSHLNQNYPNPFNPSTTINYRLSADGNVELTIYDLAGRKIATLINSYQSAGSYTVTWDASNFSSGIYIYRLKADDFVDTKKMVLMK